MRTCSRLRFWGAHAHKLRRSDVIRVREAEGEFDVELTVRELVQGGALVELLASQAMAQHLACRRQSRSCGPPKLL